MKKNQILIVDNSALFISTLKRYLSQEKDFEVVAEAESGEEAIKKAKELSPDVVLMDLKMEGIDGLEATQAIKKENPRTCVIILTVYDEDLYRTQAAEAGAAAYILKEAVPQELIKSIKNCLPSGN